MSFEIIATERSGRGTTHARRDRYNNLIPATLYGKDYTPVLLNVTSNAIRPIFVQNLGLYKIFQLSFAGKTENVLIREIQQHPVSRCITHVDFLRITPGKRIQIQVPITFINKDKSPGLKKGGSLNITTRETKILTLPESIPDSLVVNLEHANLGDKIRASSLTLPESVSLVVKDDFAVAVIVAPRGVKAE